MGWLVTDDECSNVDIIEEMPRVINAYPQDPADVCLRRENRLSLSRSRMVAS